MGLVMLDKTKNKNRKGAYDTVSPVLYLTYKSDMPKPDRCGWLSMQMTLRSSHNFRFQIQSARDCKLEWKLLETYFSKWSIKI